MYTNLVFFDQLNRNSIPVTRLVMKIINMVFLWHLKVGNKIEVLVTLIGKLFQINGATWMRAIEVICTHTKSRLNGYIV